MSREVKHQPQVDESVAVVVDGVTVLEAVRQRYEWRVETSNGDKKIVFYMTADYRSASALAELGEIVEKAQKFDAVTKSVLGNSAEAQSVEGK